MIYTLITNKHKLIISEVAPTVTYSRNVNLPSNTCKLYIGNKDTNSSSKSLRRMSSKRFPSEEYAKEERSLYFLAKQRKNAVCIF